MKIDQTGKPMMSDAEIDAITEIVCGGIWKTIRDIRQIRTVLEWGAGNSTRKFSEMAAVKSWVAVEHNGHYIEYLAKKVDPNIVTLIWVQDDADYIDCVKRNIEHYDLILIDGRDDKREACLDAAMKIIHKNGVVLLHDSSRYEYKDWIAKYPYQQKLTEGEVPDPAHPGFFMHRGLTAFFKTPQKLW